MTVAGAQPVSFDQYRPLLFGIAYRMLGSVMDAEDAVQETWLRWQRATPAEVEAPKAYLATIITRLCVDQLRSARARREEYVGPWLPSPLLGSAPDAAAPALAAESLSMAFLVLLETLSPIERAVFLLHDVFGFEFTEIAPIVEKTAANCRQIAKRARAAVDARRPRFEPVTAASERLLAQFLQACASGDLPTLIAVLKDDITLWSDGGGVVLAARNPIYGAKNVAAFMLGIIRKAPPAPRIAPVMVNNQPGFITYSGTTPVSVFVIEPDGDRVAGIRVVVNPHKLTAVPPPDETAIPV
jgi:RNA polymerase sigma-70 factor (ECF subfamily)